ncbi:MAG: methyltransferase domain-containing protein [Planctomycetota bacterium]|nr:methyltransferase domain-containing protein [Planctomycetota bacterium]
MQVNLPKTESCRVCGSHEIFKLLDRGSVPVNQHRLMASPDGARQMSRGRLHMRVCQSCGFVFNGAFEHDLIYYGREYDNTQAHSESFGAYAEELVDLLVHAKGVQNCRIVEVGCGKGHFLRRLVARHPANFGDGYDPSYQGKLTAAAGRLNFHKSLFDPRSVDAAPDVVICRHVIEHIEQPLQLLRDVREALGDASSAKVFFETPCIEWILRENVIWDFFYEHCSLFSAESLSTAFRAAGFQVESVDHVFGGPYLWLEATPTQPQPHGGTDSGTAALAAEYARGEARRIADLRKRASQVKAEGDIALWGAGAKGVTFAQLIDPDRELISSVVDINPQKQGRFLPGSGHKIIGPERLKDANIKSALVLNPNYRAEIVDLLAEQQCEIDVIDVMKWIGDYQCN